MIVKIVKIYLGPSLVLLWVLWGQFIFGQFLGPAYISQDLQAPSYVVGTNNKVLIYCTCCFQGGSLCFSFFCLLVSSALTQRARWWTLFFLGSLVQSCCGEGGMLQTNNSDVRLQCLSHTGSAPAHGACSLPATLLRLQVAPRGTIRGRPWAACTSQV